MQSKLKETRLDYLFQELDLIKQELIQAENKIGWSTAFFAIIISVLIAIGLQTSEWLIIGPLITCPVLSLLTLIIALVPSIKLWPSPQIHSHDRLNIMKISLCGYEQVRKKTSTEESLIESINLFARLAFRKYKLIKIAFWITFFWIIIVQKGCCMVIKQSRNLRLNY